MRLVPAAAAGTRKRRRFFRRHRMGLPSVIFVGILALVGFWWTVQAPARGDAGAGNAGAATIPRGCLLPEAATVPDVCRAEADVGALSGQPPSGLTQVCRNVEGSHGVEVWSDRDGQQWLHWVLRPVTDAQHPLGNYWAVAWIGGQEEPSLRFTGVAEGWAMVPSSGGQEQLAIWAGAVALGGTLEGGLHSVKAYPIGVAPTGDVRLAASINSGAIVMEIPPEIPFELVKSREALRFVQWTADLRCG